jgi:hypothetical protein
MAQRRAEGRREWHDLVRAVYLIFVEELFEDLPAGLHERDIHTLKPAAISKFNLH